MPVLRARQRRAPVLRTRRVGDVALRSPALTTGRRLLAPVVPSTASPTDQYLVVVEVAWGADLAADPGSWVWYDHSADLMNTDDMPGVTIQRGRADEAAQTQPTNVTFTLDNPAGAYTPRNASGAHWPYVRQNTPIRISMNTGDGARVRGVVYAYSWEPQWNDLLNIPVVNVTASGILKQLGSGSAPLRSALARAASGQSSFSSATSPDPVPPLVYWPFEDGSGSTTAAEYFGGQSVTPSGAVTWASDSTLASSAALPKFAAGALLVAPVPAYTSSGGWTVAAVISIPETPAAKVTLLEAAATGTQLVRWRLTVTSALLLQLEAYDTSGTEIFGGPTHVLDTTMIGTPIMVLMSAVQVGANLEYNGQVEAVDGSSVTVSGNSLARTVPNITKVTFAPDSNLDGATFGHLAVYNSDVESLDATNPLSNGLQGWNSEGGPRIRFARLCTEQGIPYVVPEQVAEFAGVNPAGTGQVMGPQRAAKVADLLRECEAAGGLLYEPRDRAGLGFLVQTVNAAAGYVQGGVTFGQVFDHGARYNRPTQMVLDMAQQGQVFGPFRPVEDDQRRRNDWTVSQPSGTSGRYADETGPEGVTAVGRYDDSATVNVTTQGLVDQAAWRVHLGTVEQMRYPQLAIDLRRWPELISQWRECEVGSRITVNNLPAEHAAGVLDLVIEGWQENLRDFEWTATLNCSSYEPWRVATVEGAVDPLRLDTGGSDLDQACGAGDVTLRVATQTFPVWVTSAAYPADFPFDLDVDGERVRVTAAANLSSDAFGRVVANGWGTADVGGAWTVTGLASEYAVSGGAGTQSHNATLDRHRSVIGSGVSDSDVYVSVSTAVLATGAPIQAEVFARYADANNSYHLGVWLGTGQSVTVVIVRRVAGAETTLAAATVPGLTHAAGTKIRIRGSVTTAVSSVALAVKAWTASATEPIGWHATATDTTPITTAGQLGVTSQLNSGNTNATPVVVSFDDWLVDSPQLFTVTRAVNGVSRSHAAGSTVRLWRPPVIAL